MIVDQKGGTEITAAGADESEIASPGKRFFVMLGTLVGGRVSVASAAAGEHAPSRMRLMARMRDS